jgi:flagellar biosynthesis/type III secretory pathway chaperone
MNDAGHETCWESELASLLGELSASQDELLKLLEEKRRLLVAADLASVQVMQVREQELIARLQQCHEQRCRLLDRAREQGLPSDSIRSLAASLPDPQRRQLSQHVQAAKGRMRVLQHHSLTNWVLAQRTLLHLSQLLEIIATGGRQQPTYGRGDLAASTGALVDRAA